MEAEDAQRLQLATAYIAMSGSLAWRDLVSDMESACESMELRAAMALPEEKAHFEAYFTEWQQRKLVLAWMIRQHSKQFLKRK